MAIDIDTAAVRSTLINTFSVAADDQPGLIADFRLFTEMHARPVQGFGDTPIYARDDGMREYDAAYHPTAGCLI